MTPTQAEYWNGPTGDAWALHADELDPRLAHFGRAAFEALGPRKGERILDVGCGAGATSRELARAVGTSGEVTGVDISRPLLTLARSRGGAARYLEADAGRASFDATFDAVYSRFGVMFFEDPRAAFTNLRRVAPSGRLAFVCWRVPEENPAMTRPLELAKELLPTQPTTDLDAPGPFSLARREKLERLLGEAGWRSVTVTPYDALYELGTTSKAAAAFALTIGPLARALREAPEKQGAVRSLLESAFAKEARAGVVTYPAATWVVTAA